MRSRRDFSHIERPVINGVRYRSKAEANYSLYLSWLRHIKQVVAWEYEPMVFWFTPGSVGPESQGLAGVKQGTVSYRPDFRVFLMNRKGVVRTEWHEVKGYMDRRSKVALKRMALYYPEEKVIVIDSKQMAALKRQVGGVVPGWLP